MRTTEDSTLLILLVAVSLSFAWILWPFYGAILWAVVFATVFAPAHRRVLATMRQSPNMAANGFVIGPVIAAMFIATWDIFSIRTQTTKKHSASK